MNKTLYISDLDGTLLTSGQFVSRKSFETLNRLSERGLLFTYATARSLRTASKVTAGLNVKIPVIVNNGVFIVDSRSGEKLVKNIFSAEQAEDIFQTLAGFGIDPLVYSVIDGTEKFSYIPKKLTRAMRDFLDTRKGDPRHRPLSGEIGILDGETFYFACMDESGSMSEAYEKLKSRYYCVYSKDIYSGDQWLEIMPKTATKANAAVQLKKLLGCDKLVVFGDGVNDIPLFEASDECCAVSNAAPELKAIAGTIIGSNNEDSVAEYISRHFKSEF